MSIVKAPLTYEQWGQCGKYFEWRDHNVFFQRGGKGEVMLTLHGFPTCGWDWCWVSRFLIERFHMVVPDLLDYGYSLNANKHTCSIKNQADMIEALMKHRGIKEAHILAHDVGDTVAQELLARHNESSLSFRILSCIFLNGGIIPELHRPRPIQTLLASPLGGLMCRFGKKAKFLNGFAEVFGPETRPEGTELTDYWPALVGVNGRGSFARRIRYMAERKKFANRWVGAIRDAYMPLFLINGLDDPVSGAHVADAWSKLVPKAKLARLPGIGHYPQVEAPDTVAELVNTFHDCIVEKSEDKESA